MRVRVKSDEAFGLLRERVSSQNSQQNFQFALFLFKAHTKSVLPLSTSLRHVTVARGKTNAKSSRREEEEEKGAGRGTKKKNLSGIGSVSRATDGKKGHAPRKGQIRRRSVVLSPIFTLSLVLIFSQTVRAPKKKRKCEPVVRRRRCCRRQRRYRRGAIPSPLPLLLRWHCFQIIVDKEERRAR